MVKNWCAWFNQIDKDPSVRITDLTIREFLLAREHVKVCLACEKKCSEVLEQAPPRNPFTEGRSEN